MYMANVTTKKLDNLDPALQEWVLDAAANAQRLKDVINPLREHGVEVSVATLTRFVRRHREKVLAEDAQDMKGAVEGLANRGQAEALRKGTLEALRQRLYEEALKATNSPEQTLKMYGELLKEEAKLKELAIAERKLALAEEEVRLQKVRLRLAARAQGEKKRVKLNAVSVVENAVGAQQIEERSSAGTVAELKGAPKLAGVVKEMEGIVNGAGLAEEKALAARATLARERELVEEAKSRAVEEVKME
jgi:hypothetical protein